MKTAEFIYFKKYNNGLYEASTNENINFLHRYFESIKLECVQYYNVLLPNVNDIIDDIIDEYMDVAIFYVDAQNFDFTMQIVRNLHEESEDSDILLIGLDSFTCEEDYVTVMNLKESLTKLEDFMEIPQNKRGIEDLRLHLYENKLVPAKYCETYGVTVMEDITVYGTYKASKEEILSEVSFLLNSTSDNTQILFRVEYLEGIETVLECLAEVKEKIMTRRFLVEPIGSIDVNKIEDRLNGVCQVHKTVEVQNALKNGIQSFYLGYYPMNILDGYAKHIMVPTNEITPEFLEKLSSNNAVNSAIYGTGKRLAADEVKEMSKTTSYLFSNYIGIEEVDSNDERKVSINDTEDYSYKVMRYSEYQDCWDTKVFVTVENEEDLKCLRDDISEYRMTGSIRKDRMWKAEFINRCRFSKNGYCSLSKLPRLIVENGKVYSCLYCKDSIGEAGSMQFELQKNACIHQEAEEVRRKCDACEMRTSCAHCTMLPENISQESYCDFMKSDIDIIGFMKDMINITYLSFANATGLEGVNIKDVKVMVGNNDIEVFGVNKGKVSYFNESTTLIQVKEKYVIVNAFTKKIVAINKNMFIICELMRKMLSVSEIRSYLMDQYQISEEDSAKIVGSCLEILKKHDFIEAEVYQDVL